MKSLEIRELATDKELDHEAMAEISGGSLEGLLSSVDILSPDFFNVVTPITGVAEIPTMQTNNLAQADHTVATNGYGINFVSNNKFADQYNSNYISGVLSPFVGAPSIR